MKPEFKFQILFVNWWNQLILVKSCFQLSVEKQLVLHQPNATSTCATYPFNQVKPKPIVTHLYMFSHALCQLCAIILSSDWFTGLSVPFVISRWLFWVWFNNTQLKTPLNHPLISLYFTVAAFAPAIQTGCGIQSIGYKTVTPLTCHEHIEKVTDTWTDTWLAPDTHFYQEAPQTLQHLNNRRHLRFKQVLNPTSFIFLSLVCDSLRSVNVNNLKTNTITIIIIMLLGFENTDGTDVCTLHNCIHI